MDIRSVQHDRYDEAIRVVWIPSGGPNSILGALFDSKTFDRGTGDGIDEQQVAGLRRMLRNAGDHAALLQAAVRAGRSHRIGLPAETVKETAR